MSLPRVQIVGDSIAMAYAPLVAEALAEEAIVTPPTENAGDSAHLLANLDEWVLADPPDCLHLNCGLHDLRRLAPDDRFQQPIDAYRQNLGVLFERVTAALPGRVVWATTTPVIDARQNRQGKFHRFNDDVEAYNGAARAVAEASGVPLLDLYEVVRAAGPEACISGDGVHMSDRGNSLLALAVAARIREVLSS